jgi:AcrR family transcriptional regulator
MVSPNARREPGSAHEAGDGTKPVDRLVSVATELFSRHGFRAVGVEQIVQETGVTKMTLYRHFASKDELGAACLRKLAEAERQLIASAMARHSDDPLQQIRAIVAAAAQRMAHSSYRGWPMTNAAVEIPDPVHPVRAVFEPFKAEIRHLLGDLAEKAGLNRPGKFADGLLMLLEGAAVSRQSFDSEGPSGALVEIVDGLIKAFQPPS